MTYRCYSKESREGFSQNGARHSFMTTMAGKVLAGLIRGAKLTAKIAGAGAAAAALMACPVEAENTNNPGNENTLTSWPVSTDKKVTFVNETDVPNNNYVNLADKVLNAYYFMKTSGIEGSKLTSHLDNNGTVEVIFSHSSFTSSLNGSILSIKIPVGIDTEANTIEIIKSFFTMAINNNIAMLQKSNVAFTKAHIASLFKVTRGNTRA